jgi:acetolactate synthase-1/2/3 large subunit
MRGADLLIQALEREGTEIVFGFPGGTIMPVYDALLDSRLRHVLVRHEQAAAFAADGFSRTTGKVGVCMSTSGPGATNLVTGIANAMLDSVPIVAITGQVPTTLMGTDAFQEVDIFGITLPLVKHSFVARRVEQLPSIVHDAFRIASTGRPGPVLIDLPKDVAVAETQVWAQPPPDPRVVAEPDETALQRTQELIERAHRPVIYAGGGIVMAKAVPAFRAFVERTQIPVVATLKGLGCVPTTHPLFLGMLGMHGTRAANLTVQEADLLLCIGARFDDRATGAVDGFAPEAKVVHFDVDASEVGKLKQVDVAVVGELRLALQALTSRPQADAWRETCAERKALFAWRYDTSGSVVRAPSFLKRLSEAAGGETTIACDVGQHQMWVAQHCRISRPEHHLSSGGLGAMGYGVPAAIGAQMARPGARVVSISGDGSIMMNVQELATVRRYDLPIKMVVLDNNALGMVRQWQELFFDGRYSETELHDNPDFTRVAEAFGIPAFRVDREEGVDSAIDRLLSHRGPVLAHVPIDPRANVWPLVPPGASNDNMLEQETQSCAAH